MATQPVTKPEDRLKTVHELADELKIHRITVYRLLKNGHLHGTKIGRVWRFHTEDVRRWLDTLPSASLPAKPADSDL